MKILHIANDFSETKVHANLYQELDKLGVEQTVFNPIRIKNKQSIGKNEWETEHTRFVYAPVVKPFHRYVYHIKRRRVFRALLRSIDIKQFNLVHATTLLTDGGQAYFLHKKFHLPYVVSVRNTDINGFLDKLPHTWKDARKILLNAEKIFFISEGLKEKFENHRAVRNIIPKIKYKFVLLPNGIEDYFLDNIKTDQRQGQGHGIIYIGNFTNNKNVCRLARSVIRLQQDPSFLDVRLTIIGGGQQTDNEIDEIIENNKTTINYLGRINDKQRLSEILCENSIFAMPSIHETFGLVYLEALSQNLAVVYTKGQGIDGLFDQSVGIGVNPFSDQDIYSALKEILTNRDKYNNKGVDFSQFRWQTIARKYLEHYRQVLGCADIDKSLLVSFKKILRGGGKYKLKFLLRRNKIGFSSQIESRTFLKGCNIGKYVYVGSDCVINYATIGNYTCIASTVKIGGMEHSYRYPSISPRLSDECAFGKITTIGNDVWIGANVVVRQGVTIGDGAVIGAGSIVTHDVPPYTISYGSPAVVRKKRFEDEEREKKIKESHYWEKSPKEARHIIIRLLNS